ncbi:MAG: hypothetical protein J5928_02060 [Firmicutes bacterium]|nr:hypothetical protein [Bacillota bacterium]
MKVKVRKVGNSMVLTVPNAVAEDIALYEGQEFEVAAISSGLAYTPVRKKKKVNWDKYSTLRGLNVANGMDPAEYIRKSRDKERDVWND